MRRFVSAGVNLPLPGSWRVWVVGVVLVSWGCGNAAGPDEGFSGHITLVPNFYSRAAGIDVRSIEVSLTRVDGTEAVRDTVSVSPGEKEIEIALDVSLLMPSEDFDLRVIMKDDADEVVYRNEPDPQRITVSAADTATLIEVAIAYVGPGNDAETIAIVPVDATVWANVSIELTAVARDAAGDPVTGMPVEWVVLDALVTIQQPGPTTPSTATIVAGTAPGIARIEARDARGNADTTSVTVRVRLQGQLLATTNQGNLWVIDIDAGMAQLIGDAGVFGGQDLGWTGLSFDAAGTLLVTSRQINDQVCSNCSHVYTVDPNTGSVLMEVGSAGVAFISDIDLGSDGNLYGNHWSGSGWLVTIDPTTALATIIGQFGMDGSGRPLQNGGLALHPQTGELWAVESSFAADAATIFTVDPATGMASNVARLGLGGVPTPFGLDNLEILPDGRFVGFEAGRTSGGASNLYEINPTPDPVSGLAELTLIPLTFDGAIEGKLNGLENQPLISSPETLR